jgi:hypothetical protein
LIGCDIRLKQALVSSRWLNAYLEGCTFQGKLRGCDFGHLPEFYHPDAGIKNCDFTHATVDWCQFIDCDISTLQFQGWPHFAVASPKQNASLFASLAWPTKDWKSIWVEVLRSSPENTSAVLHYTPSLLKEMGGSEEEIRTLLGNVKEIAPGSVIF